MPRLARVVIPGVPHHVTQRGNNKQDVFFTKEDRLFYLKCLREYACELEMDIIGYCLMVNHVHLIVLPRKADSLAAAIGRVHWRYAQNVNKLHGRSGHLWQGRFFSCALDKVHAYRALAYIERNPVRAKIVKSAWDYDWSSAKFHSGAVEPPEWLDMRLWSKWTDSAHWKVELKSRSQGEDEDDEVRFNTMRGRPLGSDTFLAKAESFVGHRLRPLPVGRPRKKRKDQK